MTGRWVGRMRDHRMDFVRFGHDGELNCTNGAPTLKNLFAHTVTSIHQRAVDVQNNRPLKIRRIDAPTVVRNFAKRRIPSGGSGGKPAVLLQFSNGQQLDVEWLERPCFRPEPFCVPDEAFAVSYGAVLFCRYHKILPGRLTFDWADPLEGRPCRNLMKPSAPWKSECQQFESTLPNRGCQKKRNA